MIRFIFILLGNINNSKSLLEKNQPYIFKYIYASIMDTFLGCLESTLSKTLCNSQQKNCFPCIFLPINCLKNLNFYKELTAVFFFFFLKPHNQILQLQLSVLYFCCFNNTLSIGCKIDVVLAGKNCNLMFFKTDISMGCCVVEEKQNVSFLKPHIPTFSIVIFERKEIVKRSLLFCHQHILDTFEIEFYFLLLENAVPFHPC